MSVSIRLATVLANGRRYIVIYERGTKVRCKGEVLRASGFSAVHGPDRTFLADAVRVEGADLTEALLAELLAQAGDLAAPAERALEEKKRKRWAKLVNGYDTGVRFELTGHARRQLEREGYGSALDLLAGGMDEDTLQDAAMDMAAYHLELTQDGVKEGRTPTRQAAAEHIYQGMLRALEKKKAKEGG